MGLCEASCYTRVPRECATLTTEGTSNFCAVYGCGCVGWATSFRCLARLLLVAAPSRRPYRFHRPHHLWHQTPIRARLSTLQQFINSFECVTRATSRRMPRAV